MNTHIRHALDLLQREVLSRRLLGVEIFVHSDTLLQVRLVDEDRQLWLGHEDGRGFFIVQHPDSKPEVYFALTTEAVTKLLAPPTPEAPSGIARPTDSPEVAAMRELIESISSTEPSAEQIRQAVERLPATDRGLDVFATVAAIKAYRAAVDVLSRMLCDNSIKEEEYHKLFKQNPWMFGSQYSALIASDKKIWFGAEVDLVLASAAGHVELVELKRPDTTLLVRATRARTWRASAELSDVQAQARAYLRIIDSHASDIEKELGFEMQSMSRLYRSVVLIVAGRSPIEPDAGVALRDFKVGDPRIVLMTYDDVFAIAEATVQLFERRVSVVSTSQLPD